jgi:hypothetical protein
MPLSKKSPSNSPEVIVPDVLCDHYAFAHRIVPMIFHEMPFEFMESLILTTESICASLARLVHVTKSNIPLETGRATLSLRDITVFVCSIGEAIFFALSLKSPGAPGCACWIGLWCSPAKSGSEQDVISYFTLEKPSDIGAKIFGGTLPEHYMIGGWVKTADGSLAHNNYGICDSCSLESFALAAFEAQFGKGATERFTFWVDRIVDLGRFSAN